MTSPNPTHVVSVQFIDPIEEMLQTPMQERIMQNVTNSGSFHYPAIGGSNTESMQAALAQREYLVTRNPARLDERNVHLKNASNAALKEIYRTFLSMLGHDTSGNAGTSDLLNDLMMMPPTRDSWRMESYYYYMPSPKYGSIQWFYPADEPNWNAFEDSHEAHHPDIGLISWNAYAQEDDNWMIYHTPDSTETK